MHVLQWHKKQISTLKSILFLFHHCCSRLRLWIFPDVYILFPLPQYLISEPTIHISTTSCIAKVYYFTLPQCCIVVKKNKFWIWLLMIIRLFIRIYQTGMALIMDKPLCNHHYLVLNPVSLSTFRQNKGWEYASLMFNITP